MFGFTAELPDCQLDDGHGYMGVRTIDYMHGLCLREVRRALLHLLHYVMLDE